MRDGVLCMCIRLKQVRSPAVVTRVDKTREIDLRKRQRARSDSVHIGHKALADVKCHSLFVGDISRMMLVLRCLWLEQGQT
jgi:hypothetical protein